MEVWLGVMVVLVIVVLNFLVRKRSCAGCTSCSSNCRGASPARQQETCADKPASASLD